LSAQATEQVGVGIASLQNRQGYCSCCQVHYSILDQHLLSSQHRRFATCCKHSTGTNILMKRFLQDVQQYHPQLYHDNRPTYDDMPDVFTLPTPKEDSFDVCLFPRDEAKKADGVEGEKHTTGGAEGEKHPAESCTTNSCKSKGSFMPLFQKPEPTAQIYHQDQCVCSNIKNVIPLNNVAATSHEALFGAVTTLPHSSLSSPLALNYFCSPEIAKNVLSPRRLDQAMPQMCIKQEHRDKYPSSVGVSPSHHVNNPSVSHLKTTIDPGSSSHTNSGLLIWKHDGLSQDKTRTSELYLRNLVSSHSSGVHQHITEDGRWSRISLNSVDEVIEEVILKYCYGISPAKLSSKDEEINNSSLNFQSLLGQSNTEGSDISFDLNVPIQSGVYHSKDFVKEIGHLQEIHVSLQDNNYESQLNSVLQAYPVKGEEEKMEDHSKEAVIQSLSHVPPSFVGKTWSQIMHEDDLKVDALVKDFKKGRFRSYFDNESLTNCGEKSSKKQKTEGSIEPLTDNKTEIALVKTLPLVSDHVSDSTDSHNPSLASDTLCKSSIIRNPGRKTWRLASRCQIVKVSHGTQTSVVNYPVIKRKVIRKEQRPLSEEAKFDWLENERTPEMKTRLCALKLPESYNKLLRPVQPNSVVYVLSYPETNPCRGKPGIQKTGRNQCSTNRKDCIRYKYKPCPLKYYDPLTNRVLKTPPRSAVRGKGKKAPCARQLFRNLSIDLNMKKIDDGQKESVPSKKSLNLSDFSSSSSAPLLADVTKGKDFSSRLRPDGPSDSAEGSELAQSEEKPYKHLISPLDHSQLARETPLSSLNSIKKPIKSPLLKSRNPKMSKKKKEDPRRELDFSKKSSEVMHITHAVRSGRREVLGKEGCGTRKMRKAQMNNSSGQMFSVQGCQTGQATTEKKSYKGKT
ncbi:LOW QUALITY PROTEIN: DBF4-type zinc finger-containing protein 2-like, partial [Rhinatrema bivittatum]|uniref:LOW QUALITY PROTEIN: DBF4-type zinc finger-containing protein 2-like n=1 Tax=Rhinatrema bivittatum TaxID=194408 RepID=UPI00112CF596